MAVPIKNLEIEIKGDARKLNKEIAKQIRYAMDNYALDAFTMPRTRTWQHKLELRPLWPMTYEKKEDVVKKLYKVHVVVTDDEIYEENIVARTEQEAWYNVVRKVAPDAKLEDLTVSVLSVCQVKDKKCCC